ncbi:MAG: aquaporin [Bacteroidia bacterium]|nr:aquaporin [Bacteroidia bacterium]MBP7245524.1 aquaporin [Bacteroidia bacterium]
MKKYYAEAIGTYMMVFCGTGAIIINQEMNGVITHPGIAATFGLIVAAVIYALGDVSGAHINPAVTIAFALRKVFPVKEIIPYVLSQSIGAVLASLTLHLLFPLNEQLGGTFPAGSIMQAFVLEILLTFFLMFVILRVSHGSREQGIMAGMAIGAVVLLEALFAGPITGASMNPARSIGPALVSGEMQFLWIYIAAPIAGSSLAVWMESKVR